MTAPLRLPVVRRGQHGILDAKPASVVPRDAPRNESAQRLFPPVPHRAGYDWPVDGVEQGAPEVQVVERGTMRRPADPVRSVIGHQIIGDQHGRGVHVSVVAIHGQIGSRHNRDIDLAGLIAAKRLGECGVHAIIQLTELHPRSAVPMRIPNQVHLLPIAPRPAEHEGATADSQRLCARSGEVDARARPHAQPPGSYG